jgi:hypothetical protein
MENGTTIQRREKGDSWGKKGNERKIKTFWHMRQKLKEK